MRTVSLRRLRRAGAACLTAAGLVHLLAPACLLGLARRAYRRVLAVEFRPRAGATRRVRAIGLVMVLIGRRLWPDDR